MVGDYANTKMWLLVAASCLSAVPILLLVARYMRLGKVEDRRTVVLTVIHLLLALIDSLLNTVRIYNEFPTAAGIRNTLPCAILGKGLLQMFKYSGDI